MSTINIQQNHGSDLKILCDQSESVISDLCKLSANILTKGPSLKVYQVASQRLGLNASKVQSAVEALIYLYFEACKNEMFLQLFCHLHFQFTEEYWDKKNEEVVADLNLKEESIKILYSMYLSLKPVLGKALPEISVTYPEYSNLEWRFETQVSCKSIRNEIIPKVVMKLDLERGNKTETVCIQSDIPNIIHMSQALNQALEESKTNHSRRVQRAIL